MALFLAGQKLTAQHLNDIFPDSKVDIQTIGGNTTSSSYSETLTGGTACSFTFTAPTSGRILVVNTSQMVSSSAAQVALMAYIIREGNVIGSGTTFYDAGDDDCMRHTGSTDVQASWGRVHEGLTPGLVYNIRQKFRSNGGATATFSRKRLSVAMLPA